MTVTRATVTLFTQTGGLLFSAQLCIGFVFSSSRLIRTRRSPVYMRTFKYEESDHTLKTRKALVVTV